jgi:hypothetical protein
LALALYEESKIVLEVIALVMAIFALFVSYKGYSETKRPVFARLSLAFIGLSINFLLQFLADILMMYGLVVFYDYLRLGASFFEMIGFFFLAFSHMVKVYQEKKLAAFSFIIFNPAAAFKILSIYFVFYAALETTISYFKNRSKIILIIALGLAGFAVQSILSWMSEFVYNPLFYQLFSLVFQIIGIISFSVPIWIYYRGVK